MPEYHGLISSKWKLENSCTPWKWILLNYSPDWSSLTTLVTGPAQWPSWPRSASMREFTHACYRKWVIPSVSAGDEDVRRSCLVRQSSSPPLCFCQLCLSLVSLLSYGFCFSGLSSVFSWFFVSVFSLVRSGESIRDPCFCFVAVFYSFHLWFLGCLPLLSGFSSFSVSPFFLYFFSPPRSMGSSAFIGHPEWNSILIFLGSWSCMKIKLSLCLVGLGDQQSCHCWTVNDGFP